MKHKGVCWVMMLLVVVGAVNWGLVGLGGFMGGNWNLVNLLLGSVAPLENLVYLLVGLSGLGLLAVHCNNKDCGCMKMGK